MSSSTAKAFALEKLSDRALGYGFPGITIDGNDVVAVYEATEAAVRRAKEGGGPTLIEAQTYRWKGHSRSDKNLYRTKEEIDEWKAVDPILRFKNVLLERNFATAEELAEIEKRATDQVIEAVNVAVKATPADPAGLIDAVFKKVSA